MSTHLPGFQSFFSCLFEFLALAKLATSSMRVNAMTAHSLTTAWVQIQQWHVRKFRLTWGQALLFAGYSVFHRNLQLASHLLTTLWHKCGEKLNSESQTP